MRATTITLLSMLASAAVAGCAPSLALPDGFVRVDEGPYARYAERAVSADGVVVAARSEPNPEGATLAFWAEAVRRELASREGYRLDGTEETTTDAGAPMELMTFAADVQGMPMRYLVGVAVRGDRVLVAEAGGQASAVEPKRDALVRAIRSVR